jgi:hypothetical protein
MTTTQPPISMFLPIPRGQQKARPQNLALPHPLVNWRHHGVNERYRLISTLEETLTSP